MAAGKYSFVIEQGTTVDFEIQYKDSSNVAIDLTNHHARMHIRESLDATTTIVELSSSLSPDGTGLNFSGSNGTTPPTSGSIGVYISAASSSVFTFNQAVYDLEIVSGSRVIRLLEGQIRLSREVTR